MSIVLDGTTGITTPAETVSGAVTAATVTATGLISGATNYTGFKNRIINGNMAINQRNAGASVTPTNGQYCLDRWQMGAQTSSTYSVQQSSTAPTGFSNSLLVTSLASTSIVAGSYYSVSQIVEGFNSSDLGFGTANAKTITISFWVRSSLTGTFGGWVQNGNVDRSYPFSYTISAANTWEQKTVTISGDTTGTWAGATNGAGMYVGFSLGMGSTRQGTANSWQAGNYRSVTGETPVVGTNGATFYITGVQLEKGSTAPSFDYRPYGTELALCQRYALMIKNGTTSIDRFGLGSTVSATTVQMLIQHPVAFRAAPTLTTTGTAADYQVYSTAITACNAAPTLGEGSQYNSRLNFVTAGGLTGGQVSQCSGANTNAYLLFSAEL
jgi:hypothetical protein